MTRTLIFAGVLLIAANQVVAVAEEAAVTPGVPATGAATSQKKEVAFDVWEYRVSGNTLVDQTLVERTVYSFLGPGRTVADVEAARLALETLYKNAGFPTVIVDLPEQDVSNGIVTLEVVQGTIDRTRISGSRHFSLDRIRKGLPALAEGEIPYMPAVQEQLQSLNKANSDRQVTPVFRPGRTPGTVEVDLRVKDELPLHGSIELNNHNSADTSRARLVGNLRYDNLWQRLHSASLMYQMSPEHLDEVSVLAGTYVLPLGSGDDRLALYAIRSDSNSEVASAGALAVIGKGTILGARWVMPLAAAQNYYHSLTLGGDWKDFNEGTELVGADTLQTPIDYSVFSAEYGATLIGDAALTTYSVAAHFAPRGLGNSEREFDDKRFGATPNFAYLTLDFKQEYRPRNGVRLRGVVQGQLAGEPLISNEQFSAGGFESVRGYNEAEILGDDGVQASLELHGPAYAALLKRGLTDFHALVFADGALVKVRDPLPGDQSQQEVYGVGAGLRVAWSKAFEAAVDVAWPLASTDAVDKGDARVDFFVRTGF
jgi:hemolysin activation/secretion protein